MPVENPADESDRRPSSPPRPSREVRRAIAEARRSFDDGRLGRPPRSGPGRVLHALLDHLESLHEPLVASMVAEAGQPVLFAEMAQYAAA